MTASDRCIALIKRFEGFSAEPYVCPGGYWTIGYGSRFYPDGTPVRKSDSPLKDEAEGDSILRTSLRPYEAAVEDSTEGIGQSQFDALVSFAYNLGTRALVTSTLIRKVHENPENPEIRREFLRWVHANGRVLPGLLNRRRVEADLYFS